MKTFRRYLLQIKYFYIKQFFWLMLRGFPNFSKCSIYKNKRPMNNRGLFVLIYPLLKKSKQKGQDEQLRVHIKQYKQIES